MAKQTFTTGQVLTAAQVNSLQANDFNQTVSVKTANYTLAAADKGTRIEFNTSGSVTCTVNSGLFDAGDTLVIQNRGAGTATVTAGTATVNTSASLVVKQYDSGVLYFVSDSSAIYFASDAADTPLTTKGDLFTFSTAADRLAVGNNGDTLVADSAATVGLRYQSAYNGNAVINGGMDIWQRGTSAAGGYPTYLADRWMNYRFTTGSTFSRQNTGDTTNLPQIQYCQRIARDSGNTNTSAIYISQSLESEDSRRFTGQTVTLSWYARAGANFSAASSNMNAELLYGTGTNQNVIAGFTGQANVVSSTKTLTTTWQRFSITGTVNAAATQLGINLYFTPVGTAGAADYMEITGVQLELGSVATTFKRAGGTLQGELAACQRYYFRFTANTDQLLANYAFASTTTFANAQVQFPVPMRVAPTSLDTATLKFVNYAGSSFAMTSVAANETCATATQIYGTISGATAGHTGKVMGNGTGSYIGLSAEL